MSISQHSDPAERQKERMRAEAKPAGKEGAAIHEMRQMALPNVTEEFIEEDDLTPPRMAVSADQPAAPADPEQVPKPDELGAHFLLRAIQAAEPSEPDEITAVDPPALSAAERRLLQSVSRLFDDEAGLVTDLPDRSDIEHYLSELSREAVQWAWASGARSHEDVQREARTYINRRAEQMAEAPDSERNE